ncbi:MAG: UDP-N-acetylglucosamine 2-epimerase (non-hydrolyzing) [Methanomassiliicoccales archaeon]|nr:UDP-N-acetylglucosamine 2-epimerase (non-hydrolyzing) [Methanomassiliicoccales archaeon]NYT16092.1 UDP-N-acetylglucosamine 2-epimerase (non-hydrolyzing) [Methanomassiliicoccales archaeon]
MISVVLGTRPEIIKMSPIIRELEERGLEYQTIHTGQHYSYEMDRIFFEELELPLPDINLDVGSGTQANQTGRMLPKIERALIDNHSEVVLVQGDTNTVLAGALAASKLDIPVGHVEAGLRSYDRTMPEEINRVLADHISTQLYAPTEQSRENLAREGIINGVFVTGNTVVDAAFQNMEISKTKSHPLRDLGIEPSNYFLVTAHRQENVDYSDRLSGMILGLEKISEKEGIPMIFPAHPRTRKMLKAFDIEVENIQIIEPVGYLDFLQLEANARLVLTDSGGVQEETCVLGTPCVTLRDNTERPETVKAGSNILAGVDPARMVGAVDQMISRERKWINPYGDGKASARIVGLVSELLDS